MFVLPQDSPAGKLILSPERNKTGSDFVAYQPERMCAACRKKRAKSELLRIVLSKDTAVCDPEQRLPGRGVYVCKNSLCAELLRKKKALSRSFKRNIDAGAYDAVAAECAGGEG